MEGAGWARNRCREGRRSGGCPVRGKRTFPADHVDQHLAIYRRSIEALPYVAPSSNINNVSEVNLGALFEEVDSLILSANLAAHARTCVGKPTGDRLCDATEVSL
jgi:hypothetical protein